MPKSNYIDIIDTETGKELIDQMEDGREFTPTDLK